jgi:hypothetical protein
METHTDDHLPFLDVDLYRRMAGFLGHKVYLKPIHNNLNLNPGSHHRPSNIQTILSMLVHKARALFNKESLHYELEFPKTIFRENGYSIKQIQWALNLAVKPPSQKRSPPWFIFFCMSRQHMISSEKCWPNTTLNVLACCQRSPVSFVL